MIQYVAGDILQSKAAAVAHGVAPDDHFTSGLALALRERWPAMVKDFRHNHHQSNPAAGDLWAWHGPGAHIVNLMTQEPAGHGGGHPGKASVEHVNHALRKLRKYCVEQKVTSIALPKLATGVGGLEWTAVKPLIEEHLSGLPCTVIVYEKFVAGQQAAEKGV